MTARSPDAPPPSPASPLAPSDRSCRGDRLLLLLFPLLALALLWDVLVGGRVLLPAEFLRGFSPWNAGLDPEALRHLPQWNILQWDGMAQFYPWRLFLARELGGGRIPLWDPHVLTGTPFLANSQSAPLYPLHWLFALPFGPSVAVRMGWVTFLHLSLAGCFTYRLSRDLGARPLAALLAGSSYELCGFLVAWLELPSVPAVACWIPLVLLLVARAVRDGSWRRSAAAGAAIGMMLLAGHLQIAFYGLLAATLFWGNETLARVRAAAPEERRERRERLLRSVGIGLGAAVLGFGLAAVQFLPSLELSRMSHRAGAPSLAGYESYLGYALARQNWVTLLVPDYYGLPGRGDFWGQWNYGAPNVMEYAGHVGVAAFVLAVVGIVWGRRTSRRVVLLGAIGATALLMAAGTPLDALFYFGVPGFAQSGSPARALVLFCLAQALLAGLGAEALLQRSEGRWTDLLAPLGIAAGVTLLLLALLHGVAFQFIRSNLDAAARPLWNQVSVPALLRSVLGTLAFAGLLALLAWLLRENSVTQRVRTVSVAAVLLTSGWLLYLGGPFNLTASPDQVYPSTGITDALRNSDGRVATVNRDWEVLRQVPALLPPNASLAYGWRDAEGYDSLWLAPYRRLSDAVVAPDQTASPKPNGNIVFIKRVDSPLFPLLGARYVASQAPLQRSGLIPATGAPAGPPYLYEDRTALPEAYLVTDWFTAEDTTGFERLRTAGRAVLGRAAFVSRTVPAASTVAAASPAARLERITPAHLRAAIGPNAHSLLVLLEGYAPGWKAVVRRADGSVRTAPVLRTNGAFQGVFVDPGDTSVEWRYEPSSFRFGAFVSLLALAALLGVSVCRPVRRPRYGAGTA